MGTVTLEDTEEQEIELNILERTKLAGEEYLLALDAADESIAYILHLIEGEGDDGLYEFVEDENLLVTLSRLFEEQSDELSFEITDNI